MSKAAKFTDSNGASWQIVDDDLPDWWTARAIKIPDGEGGQRYPYEPEGANTIRIAPDGVIGKLVPPVDTFKAEAEKIAATGIPVHVPRSTNSGMIVLAIVLVLLAASGRRR